MPQIGDNQMAKAYIGGLQMNGTSDEPSDYVVYGLKMDEWDTGDTEFKSMAYYVKNVQIPDGVTTIGDEAFKGYGVSAMTLPSGITYIGTDAFSKMENLETMNFGYMIDGVGNGLFKGCTALTGITIESGVVEHDDTEWGGEVWYENKWAGFDLNNETFSGCTSLTGVPVTERMYNVGKNCFTDCQSLTEFTFPPNVGSFGGYDYTDNDRGVFEGTSLSSVTFNERQAGGYSSLPPKCFKGLSNLQVSGGPVGDYSYQGCDSITGFTEWTAPQRSWDHETHREYYKGFDGTFSDCHNLKQASMRANHEGVVAIGDKHFNYCTNLSSVTFDTSDVMDESVTPVILGVGNYAFTETKVPSLSLPVSGEIGDNAFNGDTALTAITLSGVTSIGTGAFGNTSISSITIPETVESIGGDAFYGTKLTEAELKANIKYGNGAYQHIQTLTSATIESGVTVIPDKMFKNDSELADVVIPDTVKNVGGSAFEGTKQTTATIKSGVTYGYGAYQNVQTLSSVTIESGVTAIPSGMFANDSGLTSIVIPDTVTSVGDMSFQNTFITDVAIKSGTTYGYAPFRYCKNLTGFTIESGVTEVPEEVILLESLNDSGNYIDVTIPDTVRTIKRLAFSNRRLSGLTIGDGVETIEGYAFKGCKAPYGSELMNNGIIIPDSVKDVGGEDYWNGGYSFSGLNVDSYEVGSGCTHIARGSFASEGSGSGKWTGVTFTIHAVVPPRLDNADAFSTAAYGIKHIYVPAESVDAYKAATNWSTYANIIEAIPTT